MQIAVFPYVLIGSFGMPSQQRLLVSVPLRIPSRLLAAAYSIRARATITMAVFSPKPQVVAWTLFDNSVVEMAIGKGGGLCF